MGLLGIGTDPGTTELAQRIFDKHFEIDPSLEKSYTDRDKQLMFQDIVYNLGYLDTAVQLHDTVVFTDYAVWLYDLLCNLTKHCDRELLKDRMVDHYTILAETLDAIYNGSVLDHARACVAAAIAATERAVTNLDFTHRFQQGRNVDYRIKYLHALLRSDTRGAAAVIESAIEAKLTLEQIYEDIIQETMCEVGELWHQSKISVDKEHYCASTSQMILSRFYSEIFNAPRVGRKILACCVGSELHELGVRMLSDLFESHGWDSIYLGAAVPEPSLLRAVAENAPDLVALSVTMPHFLPLCRHMAEEVRTKYPGIAIAVGGRAFEIASDFWKGWPIDVCTKHASELIVWADKRFSTRSAS